MAGESAQAILGELLRYHRKLSDTSLTAAAKGLGKSVGHLSNVESGRDRPSWDIIAYYEEHFHADGHLWTAFVEVQTGARPPQRAEQGDRPAYPIPGDDSDFVADVTIPDGTILPPLYIFEKIWRIKNSGSIPWIGRRLARIGAAAGHGVLHSPAFIPIDDTMPGDTIDIAITVRSHPLPGTSGANWKMIDKNGWPYFPNLRPLHVTITVVEDACPPDLSRLV
jgi:transcriptional regulator with XRE-family HTH domain